MSIYDLQALIGPIISVLVPAAGAIYTFIATRAAAARKEIDGLGLRIDELEKKRVDTLDRKLAEHEAILKNLPTKDALHELQMATERMNGDIRVIGETMRAVKETSSMLRDWVSKVGPAK